MELYNFNGGLNTRQAPELIQSNEAVIRNNCITASDQLESCKGLSLEITTVLATPHFFESDNQWFPDSDSRDYLVYQDKLLWSNGAEAQKYVNGVTHSLGIAGPSSKPIITLSGTTPEPSAGIVQYVYTYYNSVDDTESQPSPLSSEVSIATLAATLVLVSSSDPQVTNIFVYRLGNTFLSFTKIIELPNTSTSYLDTIPDSAGLTTLTSNLNGKAPTGLKYLSQAYGVFFGAIGPKLYFTRDIGNPNYWPETSYIDFHADITGISPGPGGTLVFTHYETYLVTGTNSQTFVKYLVDGTQGCVSYKSIAMLGGAVLFISTDGICTVENNIVKVVSKFKLGKQTFEPVVSVVYDEVYYCLLSDKTIISFDLRYAPLFSTYDFQLDWLTVAKDKLYGSIGTETRELFQGELLALQYKTGNLVEGAVTMLKAYNNVYLAIEGTFTFTIYLDGQQVSSREVTGTTKPTVVTMPQNLQRATGIAFEFNGIGKVKGIEYKAMERTNGR